MGVAVTIVIFLIAKAILKKKAEPSSGDTVYHEEDGKEDENQEFGRS